MEKNIKDLTIDDRHRYFYKGKQVPGVSEILDAERFVDLSFVPDDVLDDANNFGHATHHALYLEDRKELDWSTLDLHLIPYVEAWKKFCEDLKFVPNIELAEQMMYSKRWGFAGTPDKPGKMKLRNAIIDIKTANVKQKATALQLGGYQTLVEEYTKKPYTVKGAVYLYETGKYSWVKFPDPNDKHVFIGAVSNYHWKKKNIRGYPDAK